MREAPRRYNSWKLKEEHLQEICESNGQRGQERKKRIINSLLALLFLKKILTSPLIPLSSLHSNHRFPFSYFELLTLPHTLGKKERRKGRKEEERRKKKREFISL